MCKLRLIHKHLWASISSSLKKKMIIIIYLKDQLGELHEICEWTQHSTYHKVDNKYLSGLTRPPIIKSTNSKWPKGPVVIGSKEILDDLGLIWFSIFNTYRKKTGIHFLILLLGKQQQICDDKQQLTSGLHVRRQ